MSARELKFDKEAFLAQHWQRKPLLIRHGIAAFETPLPAGELAAGEAAWRRLQTALPAASAGRGS